ncbi:hypothetical protein D3C78_952340 [compost metagenome]
MFGQPLHLEHWLGARVDGIARARRLLRFACGGVDDGKPERSFLTRHGTQNRNRGQERTGIGMFAAMEDIRRRADFHLLAAIHDDGAVGDLSHHTHIMGDEQNRRAFLFLKRLDEVQYLALNGHIERGRRLVGDQQLRPGRKRHGDHHALAHAAGKAMRIFIETRCGRGNTDLFEKADRFGPGIRFRHGLMAQQGLGNLVADGEERIETGHRLLKDHRNLVAPHLPHGVFGKRQQVASAEQDFALNPAAFTIQQPHDGERGNTFARSAFTDDCDRLARPNIEGNITHHGFPAAIHVKGRGEVADGKHGIFGTKRCCLRHGHDRSLLVVRFWRRQRSSLSPASAACRRNDGGYGRRTEWQ